MSVPHMALLHDDVKRLTIDDVRGIISLWSIFLVYFGYSIMFLLGYTADKYHRLRALLGLEVLANRAEPGYAPCTSDLDYFYLHYPYQQVRDSFERPICSVPGATFDILDRYSDDGYNSFK
jgi:hypothetical protein